MSRKDGRGAQHPHPHRLLQSHLPHKGGGVSPSAKTRTSPKGAPPRRRSVAAVVIPDNSPRAPVGPDGGAGKHTVPTRRNHCSHKLEQTSVNGGLGGGRHRGGRTPGRTADCAHPLAILWFLSHRRERNPPPRAEPPKEKQKQSPLPPLRGTFPTPFGLRPFPPDRGHRPRQGGGKERADEDISPYEGETEIHPAHRGRRAPRRGERERGGGKPPPYRVESAEGAKRETGGPMGTSAPTKREKPSGRNPREKQRRRPKGRPRRFTVRPFPLSAGVPRPAAGHFGWPAPPPG